VWWICLLFSAVSWIGGFGLLFSAVNRYGEFGLAFSAVSRCGGFSFVSSSVSWCGSFSALSWCGGLGLFSAVIVGLEKRPNPPHQLTTEISKEETNLPHLLTAENKRQTTNSRRDETKSATPTNGTEKETNFVKTRRDQIRQTNY
jgi:hypothetical protein